MMRLVLLSFLSVASSITITTSGLSAGAYMASQYHVAFSSEVSGAALFAGGPFYCSQGNVNTAQLACMSLPTQINLAKLESDARAFEKQGVIDPLVNIQQARVFLWSGTKDSVVKYEVVNKARDWYLTFGAEIAEKLLDAQHAQPTLDYGNACGTLGSPYISKCDYDGAGHALQHILSAGTLKPKKAWIRQNLHKIKQSAYFGGGNVPGLSSEAHVYVPSGCAASHGKGCSVHVAFHGCKQNVANVGMQYVEHAGYLEWAEANDIVVLFPDATTVFLYNPNACFDWWGYVDKNFAFKSSKQLSTVHRMVHAVLEGTILANRIE
jgi:poly(3-hydroxybutyrate) depolymerase